jgi:hypothetical protein
MSKIKFTVEFSFNWYGPARFAHAYDAATEVVRSLMPRLKEFAEFIRTQ